MIQSEKFGIEMSTCMVNAYEIHFIFIYFLINRTTVFGKKKKEKHQINILFFFIFWLLLNKIIITGSILLLYCFKKDFPI